MCVVLKKSVVLLDAPAVIDVASSAVVKSYFTLSAFAAVAVVYC